MSNPLNRQAFGMLAGLVVQYALGMAVNLFVQFPQHQGPGEQWQFVIHNPLVLSHLILGTLLVINAVVIVVAAARSKSAAWRLPARLGLLSLIVAWGAGDSFVTTQIDALSYLMSLGFLGAIFSYGWGVYQSKKA